MKTTGKGKGSNPFARSKKSRRKARKKPVFIANSLLWLSLDDFKKRLKTT